MTPRRPRVAVWKFASCSGCQLSLLDCEESFLSLSAHVEFAYFPALTPASCAEPFDLSLVEGSISTPDDALKIKTIRKRSKILATIGACATAGGVQALRNGLRLSDVAGSVYPEPEYVDVLADSVPISAHVSVDYELHGCPVDKHQLLQAVAALIHGRRPPQDAGPVCMECKARDATCVLVSSGAACLGPVTRSGCGAVCTAYGRGCYGCFGPAATVNASAMNARLRALGASRDDISRMYRTFNAGTQAFLAASVHDGE